MADRTVLISGAGIAGPALAHWLSRYGYQPTIVERAPAPRPGGQAVDIRGVARGVTERMGIMPAVRAARVNEQGFAYVDSAGRWSARMPAELFGGEGIVAEIEILRGDLSRILYDATGAHTEYLFGDSVTSLAEDADGVAVTFERAAPRRFDLVVGADGTHSRVRALAFGDEDRLVRPLGAYTAFFSLPEEFDNQGWFLMHNAPGRRMAAIRSERGHGTQAMFAFASPPLRYDRGDTAAQKRILAETFAGMGWEVPRLLAALRDTTDLYFDLYGQVRLDRWACGRVVLLGDAGYSPSPLTGMGTSLALVGAYVLAGELAAAGGDHALAFPRYEAALRGYAAQCQKLPPGGISGFLPRGALAIRLRNLSMGMMTRWPLRALMAKAFQKADAITLPDYATPAAAPRD
ncbi:MAG TPA: FAD-dependent monooxygenase [Rugosimonospora sp.]|nr:FAD-dependent monooxygenase [Rugosimonospora sp.]